MARRSLYYDHPLSLQPAHGPSPTLLPVGIVVQQVGSTPHMPLGRFGTRFIPCRPDAVTHILAHHRPANEPIRPTTLEFHGQVDGIWTPGRGPDDVAPPDAGVGPFGGEFSLDVTWGNPRLIPSVSVANWSGALRIDSEDHDPRYGPPNVHPITPERPIYLPFATCLRIRYAPHVAAHLGYTDIDGPESRLAVSFMHAAIPSPSRGLLWLEQPDYWNVDLAAGGAGNFWRGVLRNDPTQTPVL